MKGMMGKAIPVADQSINPLVNGKQTAFILHLSNQRPSKHFIYCPTFTHSFTHGGVSHAGSSSRAVRVRCLSTLEEPGIELATFRLPAYLLDLLSHMPPTNLSLTSQLIQ